MRTEDEINDEIERCEEFGRSRWPGMTYEQGVSAALRWALGESDDKPMSDE